MQKDISNDVFLKEKKIREREKLHSIPYFQLCKQITSVREEKDFSQAFTERLT